MAVFARDAAAPGPADQRPSFWTTPPARSAAGYWRPTSWATARARAAGSEVFSGTHRALGHPVAIRLLRRECDRDWNAVSGRFLREAQTLQIAHPSIIQVRDYGEEGDWSTS